MAEGKDAIGEMAKNNSDPNAKAMMELFFHPYPCHASTWFGTIIISVYVTSNR
jgi:hypothetical protein